VKTARASLILLLSLAPRPGHATEGADSICAASKPLEGGGVRCLKILDDMAALRNPRHPGGLDAGARESREKQKSIFYGKIVPSAYASLPSLSEGLLLGLEGLGAPSPEKRRYKAMNTFGAAALFDFVADPHTPYTGIFKGASGVMRFSYAGPPNLVGNVPGLGLKFFVDGQPSRDMVFMNSFNGQGSSTSVFLKPLSNDLPEPDSVVMKTVKSILEKVSGKSNVLHQDLARLGTVAEDGSEPAKPAVPYQVFLEPTRADGIPSDTTNDFRADLAGVKTGMAVYDVTAVSSPGGAKIHIGRIVTGSPFVASEYGDKELSFKHD
jgi:hypothetical protein